MFEGEYRDTIAKRESRDYYPTIKLNTKEQIEKSLQIICLASEIAKLLDQTKKFVCRNKDYGNTEDKLNIINKVSKEGTLVTSIDIENWIGMSEEKYRLLHAAIGIFTEAGEFLDSVIGSIVYHRDTDKVNVNEELGDCTWYLGLAMNVVESDFYHVFYVNDQKLELRHKDKFSAVACEQRDTEAERKLLEDNLNK